MSSSQPADISWIDSPQALDDACAQVADATVIALDTEFFRENTFFPVPALIQFSAGTHAFLVDPLATSCTDAFRHLLQNQAVKLLHACSEDLEVLQIWAGVVPSPLIDTQVAQGFLGDNPGMGYQKLVEAWVGKTLPKEETRSNWLERPLSAAQCEYAALDVTYLLEVWAKQRDALISLDRLDWLESDCRQLIDQAGRSDDNDTQWYTRQRQLWRLNAAQLEAYQLMTTWREGETRRRDLPRNWLISDKRLMAIAEAMPTNRYELSQVEGLTPPLIKKEGDALLGFVKQAQHTPGERLPTPWPDPMQPGFKRRFKALKKVINEHATQLGVAPEMLMRRRDLEALVMQSLAGSPLILPTGWRGKRLNDDLTTALEAQAA
ncbi:ribonuclease D [Halomonas sp. CUBES01]|uniref:Ribonuclease D n=1 Tax=Vreelandella gomseomensis TaxID=370766 RepID=A0ABU1GDJ5_9GAMM|nr:MULTISPECIES: ribonuclease D [Halomonas]MDR5875563.1 ribonuclease D [Halomonas gomseomensis]MEC4767764.1 ribonuclease D [Halomonas sp. CUBES01]